MDSHDHPDLRPSPEALLALSQREQRAQLKVFLGAAPGVGKTYAMLQAAQARSREGVDVVVGVVETHGRSETQALLQGLEVVPPKIVEYHDAKLAEMDLDAILARRPHLVLVDELAHTNAPGGRHPKRYLDVQELIAAGIDVYTTVNVQHLESLNDAVVQITGIRVRETFPDRVLDAADEVQLIDLSPEELIQRLNEGKVYVPEQAQRAIENYFRPGNLSALRELALRRTADRVDSSMRTYMQAQAIAGPWPTTDRIMACVSPAPSSARLIRAAKRRADRRHAEWLAVYVETPAHHRLPDVDRDRIERTLQLAEQLGGEAVTIPGNSPALDLINYARSRNVTEFIIGKSARSRWHEFRHGSLIHDLIRNSGRIDVYVIRSDEEEPATGNRRTRVPRPQAKWPAYLAGLVTLVMTGIIAKLLQYFVSLPNISLVFLLGVLFIAVRWGLWPSLLACLLSTLTYNFFFIQPLYTFTIASPQETLAFIVYFIVAIIASQLAARTREHADAARRREDRTRSLFDLSRAIARSSETVEIAHSVVQQISQILHAHTVIFITEQGQLKQVAAFPPKIALAENERAAAHWAWQHTQSTGWQSDTLPGISWSFFPLSTAERKVGVLGLQWNESQQGQVLSQSARQMVEALADQASVGLERGRLHHEIEQNRVLAETEKLRAALLSSISHDLRTPLASIIGSVSSLLSYGQDFSESARKDLLQTIHEEAEKLNRFVGNLLDITRLESGKLELNRQWVEIQDIIGAAIEHLKQPLRRHQVGVLIQPDLPLVRLDFVLMEQVFVNLLDNAAKYSPAGTEIQVGVRRDADQVVIEVCDQGSGVAPDQLERIFDKFYRVRASDSRAAGTGLGLSICRGIVEAHGGTIAAAASANGRGLKLAIGLPIEEQPPPLHERTVPP